MKTKKFDGAALRRSMKMKMKMKRFGIITLNNSNRTEDMDPAVALRSWGIEERRDGWNYHCVSSVHCHNMKCMLEGVC